LGFSSFKGVTSFATLKLRFLTCPFRLKTPRRGLIPENDDFVPNACHCSLCRTLEH